MQKPVISDATDLWKDSLIDYWIGLESLFAPEHSAEISYTLSLRIAAFLGDDANEAVGLLTKMKDSYDWRLRSCMEARNHRRACREECP